MRRYLERTIGLQSDLEKLPVELIKSATHQLMASFIEDEKCFTEQLELIQKVPIFLIEEIVSLIPDDWLVSKEEKKEIVNTLVERGRKILPEVIREFIKKYIALCILTENNSLPIRVQEFLYKDRRLT